MRPWLKPSPVTLPAGLAEVVGSQPLAELLLRRGLATTAEEAKDFLRGGINVDAPGLPDLAQGVAVIASAVLSGKPICVYGDYDTDGVTATTLLMDLLRSVGAQVSYHVPNRFRDGYGMNAKVVTALAQAGTHLILTCDCGIRNLAEVALARELSMQVVVTDHHELGPTLPRAEAVINPKRLSMDHPCYMLPGVGTAYLVARQLLLALDRDPDDADKWLDLVAVGIIADVVPLHGANRELARRGLSRLNSSPSPGLQALMAVSGLQGTVTEEEVAFQVVPRINSAGRLADATLGVRLLLSQSPDEAADLAVQLDLLNQERKKYTASVVEVATAEAAGSTSAVLLYRPEWHEGVLGIAAGRLAAELGVPVLLMSRKHGTNVLVGSARAPEGFILHEALEACSEHLLKYGGHAAAAGFSLLEEHFPAFRAAMLEEARRRMRADQVLSPNQADLAIPLAMVNRTLFDDLRRAAPFGEGNPPPVLHAAGVQLLSSRPIGAAEKHLRLVFRDGEHSLVGLWWGAGGTPLEPQEVELFYHLGLNRYKGEESIQVIVDHLGPVAVAPRQAPRIIQRPSLLDRRGAALTSLQVEFPDGLLFAEGSALAAADRFMVVEAEELLLLTPPPSPRLLDELVARSGARRLVLGWSPAAPAVDGRFLPSFLRTVAEAMGKPVAYVSVDRLAVQVGELEIVVRLALDALAASDLIAIDEDHGGQLLLRQRNDGRGVKESPALLRMRTLLSESRAYRRFLRTAPVAAITKAMV